MQATKKLVLVDQFDREFKRLQRPAAAVAKADHSLRVSDTLRNASLADDRKVREYVGELHRYLNVDNRAPTEERPAQINWTSEPVPTTPSRQPAASSSRPRDSTGSSTQQQQPVRKKQKQKQAKRRARGAAVPARLEWAQYGPQPKIV